MARPHLLLITIDALRLDATGLGPAGSAPSVTPNLDRLAAGAEWAGPAIAPAPWTVPAMASLMTGLQPWQHQTLAAHRAELRRELQTLAEGVRRLGWRTTAYRSNAWLTPRFGYSRGFDDFQKLGEGQRAAGHLARLGTPPELVWIHLSHPLPPWLRVAGFARAPGGGELPPRIGLQEILPHADPQRPISPVDRERCRVLYRQEVGAADELLGRLLAALERGGQRDRTLIVVAGVAGLELGEQGQVGAGLDLDRANLEVPLVVDLPTTTTRRLALERGRRAATVGLHATLIEAASGTVAPAIAPSWFRPRPAGIPSELYAGNGINELSYFEEPWQLRWIGRFADSEAEFYLPASTAAGELLGPPGRPLPGGLRDAFLGTRPLGRAGAPPSLRLERWGGDGGVEIADDPATERRLAAALAARWRLFLDAELTPGDEADGWQRARPRARRQPAGKGGGAVAPGAAAAAAP